MTMPPADEIGDLLARALASAEAGRAAEALALCRLILGQSPEDPAILNDLGNTLRSLGCLDEAVPALQRAVNLWPDEPVIAYNLGNALRQAGRGAEAETQFRRALALWPAFPEAHNNLGLVLFDRGVFAQAAACFAKAAALRPSMAEAHRNQGVALLEAGSSDAAIPALRRALEGRPDDAASLASLGAALCQSGETAAAIPCLRRAAALSGQEPARLGAWAAAVAALPSDRAPRFADDITGCLKVDGIDHQALARVGIALLRERIDLPALADELKEPAAWPAALGDGLLLRLLQVVILPDRAFESLLTQCRTRLLDSVSAPTLADLPPAFVLDFAAALAAQCHLNGHVYAVEPGGADAVAALEKRVTAALAEGLALHPLPVLVLAAYRPLFTLGDPEALRRWAATISDPAIAALMRAWFEAPLRRAALAASMPRLTPIVDPVSQSVRTQYEESPYPCWFGLNRPTPRPFPAMLRALFPELPDSPAPPARPEIMVAGCGTGRHAIETALRHPGAPVLAIDLSREALAFARDRAAALGVENVSFGQADLLACADWQQRFDLVEGVGVLHHLRDPAEGWSVLARLARLGGFLRLGLYSATARRPVAAARALLAERQFPPTPDGIRDGRQALLALPPDHPAAAVTHAGDFFALAGCRDLLFHVQEHVTTLPEIARLLEENGLAFLGFELPSRELAERYDAMFPADPARRSLANWAALEARYPESFAGMYLFWARRQK